MIFWIASYPKSGNTWLRTLISSYYYSKDGVFNENLINVNYKLTLCLVLLRLVV